MTVFAVFGIQMVQRVRSAGYAEAELVNYHKNGVAYYCSLCIRPVVSKDNYGEKYLSHFVGIVRELPMEHYRVKCRGSSSSTMSQLSDSASETSTSNSQDDREGNSVTLKQF